MNQDDVESTREDTVVVCAVVKDDEAYIDEWVDYHHALGFAHFHVYDSSDKFEMKQWGEEKGDHVTVVHFPGDEREDMAYADCARRYASGTNHSWAAFFNVADFLVLTEWNNVIEFLFEFCNSGAIGIKLRLFGSAGRRVYSPQPVTKRFLYRSEYTHERARFVVHLRDFERKNQATNSGVFLSDLNRLAANQPSTDNAVFHRYLRSIKEQNLKMGQVFRKSSNKEKIRNQHNHLGNISVFDDTAWKALQRLVPKYQKFERYLELAGLAPRFPTIHNETAAVCLIAMDEEAYVDEWVDYHHALGFSNFYVYDNSPDFELKQWASEKGNHVTAKHYPGKYKQMSAYFDCITEFAVKNNHTWVGFFDFDEFLLLKDHNNIVDLLSERCQNGSLSFNWIRFGHGDREVYQPIPLTKRFLFRENFTHTEVKTIAKVVDLDLKRKPLNPHAVRLKNGQRHDVNGMILHKPFYQNRRLPTGTAVVLHYNTKSYKEFIFKRLRGRADSKGDDFDERVIQAMNRSFPEKYPLFSNEGWEATKKFLPLYEQIFD